MRLCFYHLETDFPYGSTIGLFEVPNLTSAQTVGLHHFQVGVGKLENLFGKYKQLKSDGISPFRTANHGPGTSFYYKDPDGNTLEFSAPNYFTHAEAAAFRESAAFKNNPSGIEIDADEYIARFANGVPQKELVALR